MPNVPIERVHEIEEELQKIIDDPGNTDALVRRNQGKLDALSIEFFFLDPDEKTKELYERAKAAVAQAALEDERGPDWGTETAPPTQEFPDIRF